MTQENTQSRTSVQSIVHTLSDLKAGDRVFVVWQRRRGQAEERAGIETVVRVGRKYAYIKEYSQEAAFCRKTGCSVHDRDSNARANGYGFDVYLREEDYRKEQFDAKEKQRLEKRIVGSFGRLVNLRPEIVDKFNDILDGEGLD